MKQKRTGDAMATHFMREIVKFFNYFLIIILRSLGQRKES